MASRAKKSKPNRLASLTTGIAIGLLILSGVIMYRLFHDPLRHEVNYALHQIQKSEASLVPPNTDFALTIDRIGASAAIIQDVDPFNSQSYQRALRDGVAHARGTNLPGKGGNIFLFAHSSADLLTAERYNSVFYLMHHLEPGDTIKVWYQGVEHDYTVSEKKMVASVDTQYLTEKSDGEQLTLMTCWPPGTSLKRLIVIAKPL
jgi:LPXTG-site transpeptidase (sortase) family protein